MMVNIIKIIAISLGTKSGRLRQQMKGFCISTFQTPSPSNGISPNSMIHELRRCKLACNYCATQYFSVNEW